MSNTAAPYLSKTPQFLMLSVDGGPPGHLGNGALAATGTVSLTGLPADTEIVTIIDAAGVTAIFEFDSNAAVTAGRVLVPIGGDATATAVNLAAAINANVKGLKVRAASVLGVVTVTQEIGGVAGNTTITEAAANLTVAGFSGGVDVRVGIVDKTTTAGTEVGSVPGNLLHQGLVTGVIENDGDFDLVFTMQHSDGNLIAEFAANAVTFRVNGADVTTLTVKPRGQVVFSVESWDALKRYVRLTSGPSAGQNLLTSMSGTAMLVYFRGSLRQVAREADAP